MAGAGENKNIVEVRLVPPSIKVEVKKIKKLYQMNKRKLAEHLDLKHQKLK